MKRRVIMLVLLLALGAVVNVGVAWGCAVLLDPTQVDEPVIGLRASDGQSWEVMRADRFGFTLTHMTRAKGWNPGEFSHGPPPADVVPSWGKLSEPVPRFIEMDPAAWNETVNEYRWSVAGGWPIRSLWCDTHLAVGTDSAHVVSGLQGGFDIGLPGWRDSEMFPRVLPYRPLWIGFVIDTLFYAGIIWLLAFAPFAMRRRWRIRRGRCGACGYPVGEREVCTECGKPVTVTGGS